MTATCRKCNEKLYLFNCSKSFLEKKINICRGCNEIENKNRLLKNRKLIINNLGSNCDCCGITDFNVLSIDHINNDGILDRKRFKKWKNYLKFLLTLPKNELLSKYRCLCFNCNCAIGFYGKCPHHFDIKNINLKKLPESNRGLSKTNLSSIERKNRILILRQINRLKNKLELIKAYKNKCVRCFESNPLFLTIDHINNNGNLEKLRGNDFYQFLKRHGYPGNGTQLQLLCHNCNQSKEYKNRRENTNNKIMLKEIYIKQNYIISSNEEEALWNQAKLLYAQITS